MPVLASVSNEVTVVVIAVVRIVAHDAVVVVAVRAIDAASDDQRGETGDEKSRHDFLRGVLGSASTRRTPILVSYANGGRRQSREMGFLFARTHVTELRVQSPCSEPSPTKSTRVRLHADDDGSFTFSRAFGASRPRVQRVCRLSRIWRRFAARMTRGDGSNSIATVSLEWLTPSVEDTLRRWREDAPRRSSGRARRERLQRRG